jgi:hypothetical protein
LQQFPIPHLPHTAAKSTAAYFATKEEVEAQGFQ